MMLFVSADFDLDGVPEEEKAEIRVSYCCLLSKMQ